MARIAPFKGVLYNPQIIADLSQVVTPPYDVINPQEQERYYSLHPYNIIRLDFGRNFPSDTPEDNRYTRAARVKTIWEKEQILIQDPDPAIYLYKIQYRFSGKDIRVRTGFICLLGLEPFNAGKVRPHEKTFSAHKHDRYQLFQHCQMQFCPIFSFYLDRENQVLSLLSSQAPSDPIIDFQDEQSIRHQLWKITDSSTLHKVRELFSEKTVYIADGHHRYETSLAYQADMFRKHPKLESNSALNYTLMFLCPMEDQGLTIFPVHRALNRVSEIEPSHLEEILEEDFFIEKFPFTPHNKKQVREHFLHQLEAGGEGKHVFGLFMTRTSWYYLLTLKETSLDGPWGKDLHPLLRQLDVMILSRLIIQKGCGVRRDELDQENIIEYRHDSLEILNMVEKGKSQICFILNSTPIDQVRKIAEASLVMPRKSTYFFPKTLTGLVMNNLKENEFIQS
jgi:uncharacterized protein (DUF1015 family)